MIIFLISGIERIKVKTMIPEFANLSDEEKELMYKAPILVAILIAGADGNIDNTERKEAVRVAEAKQSRAREALIDYYKIVGMDFEAKFNHMVNQFSDDANKRGEEISDELSRLNATLPKLDRNWSTKFYASLKELAKKIAESSGGILGYLSVSYEESKYMELKMIDDPAK